MAAQIQTPGKPRLTVEAFAELILAPAYQHYRVLHDQKYPKEAPAAFRAPYYSSAMRAIRKYFDSGNNLEVITAAIIDLQSVQQNAKTRNNVRALEAFRDGSLKDRGLTVATASKYTKLFGSVEVRFSPDITGLESDSPRQWILNPRISDANDEVAAMTLEVACHIMNEHGIPLTISNFEYINLLTGHTVRRSSLRKSTITKAISTAQIVETLWEKI